MRPQPLGVSLALALSLLVGAPEGGAAPLRRSAQPASLCDLVPASGNETGGNTIDAATAEQTLSALRKAARQSAPRSVKRAIKDLISVYESLATGKGAKAFATIQQYTEKQCRGAADIDPCDLVSLEDAQALAGTPLAPGVTGNPSNPSCTYTGPVSGPTAQVGVYIGAGAKKILDIDRELDHTFTPIAGLDEAYAEVNAVFVHQSGVWVAILLVRLNNNAENVQPLETLARNVAAKL